MPIRHPLLRLLWQRIFLCARPKPMQTLQEEAVTMEFMFSVHDEKHNNEIIRDACADETGMREILKRFTCAKAQEREAFMVNLQEGKDAHIQGFRHYNNEARYTVRAFRYPTPEEQLLHAIFSNSEESGIAHAAQDQDPTYQ